MNVLNVDTHPFRFLIALYDTNQNKCSRYRLSESSNYQGITSRPWNLAYHKQTVTMVNLRGELRKLLKRVGLLLGNQYNIIGNRRHVKDRPSSAINTFSWQCASPTAINQYDNINIYSCDANMRRRKNWAPERNVARSESSSAGNIRKSGGENLDAETHPPPRNRTIFGRSPENTFLRESIVFISTQQAAKVNYRTENFFNYRLVVAKLSRKFILDMYKLLWYRKTKRLQEWNFPNCLPGRLTLRNCIIAQKINSKNSL